MFNPDFYPTPKNVIEIMLNGHQIEGKTILEPQAGKGDIVDYLKSEGAKEVLFCEINPDLCKITQNKARFLKNDFLKVASSEISHVELIVMNPPFSADEKHILHAYEIAPAGCTIISLCNQNTINNPYSKQREQLKSLIKEVGKASPLGDVFATAERKTGVNIGLITLFKPSSDYETEFNGFFMDEETEHQENALISYNVVRDLVGRYVDSIKIFDSQLEQAERMNKITEGYFSVNMGMSLTNEEKPIKRNEFKKEMQKSGWKFVFNKLNMQKLATTQLKEDINKFVEQQTEIPFSMRNIYHMLDMVIQTTGQRMDKALLEVFDTLTKHTKENRFNVEGWATNSHYMLNKRFIINNCVKVGWSGEIDPEYSATRDKIEDMLKAICYLTGDNYDDKLSMYSFYRNNQFIKKGDKLTPYSDRYIKIEDRIKELKEKGQNVEAFTQVKEFGKWYEWNHFRVRAYKKGTVHFEFKEDGLHQLFNRRIAELKGFPLYEAKKEAPRKKKPFNGKILSTFKISA